MSLVYTIYSLVNNMTVKIKYCTNPGNVIFVPPPPYRDHGKLTKVKIEKMRPGFPSGKGKSTVSFNQRNQKVLFTGHIKTTGGNKA